MSVANIQKTTEEKMVKSIESLKTDLQKVRTGRAHTGILDHVQVDYYGSMVPISQVANLSLAGSTFGSMSGKSNQATQSPET